MSLVKLAWVASCFGFLLAASQSLLESSFALASQLPSEWAALAFRSRDDSARQLLPSTILLSANLALPETTPPTVVAPLHLSLTHPYERNQLPTSSGLASLSAQAAAWQNSLGNAFCRSTPPFLVDWSDAPMAPALPRQVSFANLSLTQRFAQAVESLFHWSEMLPARDRQELSVTVATSPLPATRNEAAPLSFWTVLRQPARIFQAPPPAEPAEFYIAVNDRTIGRLSDERQALLIAERLKQLLSERDFDPDALQPSTIGGQPAGIAGDRVLFVLDGSVSSSRDQNRDLMAIKWVNNLRLAFDRDPLELVAAQQAMYGLVETADEFHGIASWYGPYFHDRLTASGEAYDQEAFTAAHPSLPFNTYLKVTNLDTEETVIVRINDRGPYVPPRTLDLSRGAARCLNSKDAGVVPYRAAIMQPYAAIAGDRADKNI